MKKMFSIVVLFLVLSSFSTQEKIKEKADREIEKFYNIETFSTEIISISVEVNTKMASEFREDNFFKILSRGNFLGYAYIGNAPSKTATFDYLVLFNENFIITKSKVLVYREEYGGEIGSRRWLKQFDGASPASHELKYNQDIIPISGATISVHSMTKAMNNLLQSIGYLRKNSLI